MIPITEHSKEKSKLIRDLISQPSSEKDNTQEWEEHIYQIRQNLRSKTILYQKQSEQEVKKYLLN